jgi:branched-chain amino acid transport system ATP-binding protein
MVMERGRTSWTGTPDALKSDHGLIDRLVGVGIH